MMLVDTNILVYANRQDVERHEEYRAWLRSMVNGPAPYAVSDHAVAGMVRVVTNPRVYRQPATIEEALAFAAAVRNQPHAQVVAPGPRFWELFAMLCRESKAAGNLVPNAYLAALAVEHGCEIITADGDFRKFPGVRWRHPFS